MTTPLPFTSHRQASDRPTRAVHGVLIVDDDALVRDTLALQLTSAGPRVATAATLGAAQAALNADHTITVVVCDINLTEESGFTLAGRLADLRPETMATEIVFISGNASSEVAIKALRHRAFDLIPKPVRRADLIARVGEAHLSATRRRQRQAMLDQVEHRMAEGEALKQRLTTALHEAEDQNRALEETAGAARHNLLAVISHELKTPLIPIVGLSDIMFEAPDLTPSEVREYAGMIRDGGEQLGTIIDRTLTYLDAEGQHATGETVTFAVEDLIAAALRDLPASDVVRVQIACPTDLRARGVRCLLAEALVELLDNAIKASPAGGTVHIAARALADGGVSVAITDTGPGLPDIVRANLGIPFLQGDSSLTRRWPGVGLGLARAVKIAQLSGGQIAFSKGSGDSGTQASLILPRNGQ